MPRWLVYHELGEPGLQGTSVDRCPVVRQTYTNGEKAWNGGAPFKGPLHQRQRTVCSWAVAALRSPQACRGRPPPPPPPTHTHTPTTTAVLTTKEYMRVVSEIKPEWLVSSSHICAAAALLTTYAWMMGCMDEWLLSVQGATMSSLQQLQLQQ